MKFVRLTEVRLLASTAGAAIFFPMLPRPARMLESVSVNIHRHADILLLMAAAFMFLVLFLKSTYFPTIITLGTCSLGRHYKRGSK
jgi:fucose permease